MTETIAGEQLLAGARFTRSCTGTKLRGIGNREFKIKRFL
jgi:hypothetical protein